MISINYNSLSLIEAIPKTKQQGTHWDEIPKQIET